MPGGGLLNAADRQQLPGRLDLAVHSAILASKRILPVLGLMVGLRVGGTKPRDDLAWR
jgi:hypothetical protein